MSSARGLSALRLLLWCVAGTVLVQAMLRYFGEVAGFSPIFRYLLRAYDGHGNFLLLFIAICAYVLRDRSEALVLVRFASERPWSVAALLFPVLCFGSLQVYHDHPLSIDEYSTAFQAQAFAAGKLSGSFPPDLLDRLILRPFQGLFFIVSRSTGEVSSAYWPSFSLILAPFYWLGAPWAANPLIGALTIPALHRLTREASGSEEAAGWAVLLAIASPVFVVTSISYYSMPAHLLCDLTYALLLLKPSPRRALLAGIVGSIALTLHVPVRHILFSFPFFVWLLFRPHSRGILAALCVGYLPLSLVLGLGWQFYLHELVRVGGPLPALEIVPKVFTLLTRLTFESRVAGLTKVWTWGVLGLLVLAVYGYGLARQRIGIRLLGGSLAVTFFAYMFFPGDQGHGWGNRALHSAWFVIPILASITLAEAKDERGEALRRMAVWGIALSLVFANTLRFVQVEAFMAQHLRQVPPLGHASEPGQREIVFARIEGGLYVHDLIQNDPFLRAPRVVMLLGSRQSAEALMTRFPDYRKKAEGEWGQWWVAGPALSPR